ncbi:MAG: protein phosphatase 2C domain-containing protein, partial [Phycisphaerales bacterium]|nr:protein phosphatase 2C domain-containing protein [Phycisphaerales bacterium]
MQFQHLTSAELTDVGKKRSNNEDAAVRLPECGVFAVADGMGGAMDGEIASRAVIDALSEAFSGRHSEGVPDFDQTKVLIREAAVNANAWIREHSESRGLSGTGSTVVALMFDAKDPARAYVVHAGDSRAYRLRGNALARLTTDHSLAAEVGIENEQSLGPMFRSMVTRAVGIKATVNLAETPVDVTEGDLFLLCSDGLTGMVPDDELSKLLRDNRGAELDALSGILVDAANRNGGVDNTTVVVVKVGSFPKPSKPEPEVEPEKQVELEKKELVPEKAAPAGPEPTPDTVERECGVIPVDEPRSEERDTTPMGGAGDRAPSDSAGHVAPTSDLECATPAGAGPS